MHLVCGGPGPSLSLPPAQTIAGQSPKPRSTSQAEVGPGAGGAPFPEAPLLPKKEGRKWVGWAWK